MPSKPIRSRFLFLLALLLALASATGSVVHANGLTVADYRVAGDASRARVVVEFSRDPNLRWFLLRSPHRLVIEFPDADFQIPKDSVEGRGIVASMQFGDAGNARSRIVLGVDGAFAVEQADVLKNEKSEGYRLVLDLVAASDRQFEQALAEQLGTTGSTVKAADTSQAPSDERVVVVVDPGHGGVDNGAVGVTGTLEKTITLAFSLELKKALEDTGKYIVHLTRDRDMFLRLDERVRIARQQEGEVFISIHADAIRHKFVRGATVYTVSDSASDAESAAKAIRENLSDQIAGYSVPDTTNEISDILTDLIRRETQGFSMRLAKTLVTQLSEQIGMIKNPHRFAGFQVLKAPDVPSVLLELGYLSNAEDEKQLRDPDWRARVAERIAAALEAFLAKRSH